MDEDIEAALENTLYGQHAVFGLIEFMLGPTKTQVCIYCALMSTCIYVCTHAYSSIASQRYRNIVSLAPYCLYVYMLHIHQ